MKIDHNRVTITDRNLAESISENVIVGEAFAFMSSKCFEQPGLSWLARLFGKETVQRNQILSLLSPDPMELPGLTIAPGKVPQLYLSSITCDRDLYRNEADSVHLLVINSLLPKGVATVNVFLNGLDYSEQSVELDKNGAGQIVLRDLPVGDYQVKFPFDTNETACQFTVAEYRLVPLVASLVNRVATGDDNLVITMSLESFGQPVDGEVKITLLDRGTSVSTHSAVAREGMLQVKFQLKGDGPHSLSVILTADPLKTASVPLTGSRAHERSRTVFSQLGTEVVGSLLPSQNSKEVRGIYLEDATTSNAPFSLERVDAKIARLRANVAMEHVTIVAIDPSHPNARADAPDPARVPHPAQTNEYYKKAEELFGQKKYAEALELFLSARDRLTLPHPYFAYFAACCHARLQHHDEAISYLRLAIEDGWNDFSHMSTDEDLEFIWNSSQLKGLQAGGRKDFSFDSVTAGQVLEIETSGPMTVLAIGTYVDGKPWEGWASLINPDALSVEVKLPEVCEPDSTVVIEIGTPEISGATIYAIVKDARLLSTDTPISRLAGRIKTATEEFSQLLKLQFPSEKLSTSLRSHLSRTRGNVLYSMMSVGSIAGAGGDEEAGWGAPPGGAWGGAEAMPQQAGGMIPPGAAASPRLSANFGASDEMIRQQLVSPMASPMRALYEAPVDMVFDGGTSTGERIAAVDLSKAKAPKQSSQESPVVLFAGFVPGARQAGAVAELAVKLPDKFADYLVDVFVISEGNWTRTEHRFTAVRDPFAELTVPVFAAVGEQTTGHLTVGSRTRPVCVKVTRNGEPVDLIKSGTKHNPKDTISGAQHSFTFPCLPGDYEAVIEDESGSEIYKYTARVSEPGKLKRRALALKLLEAGQSISFEQPSSFDASPGTDARAGSPDSETITGLTLLPGLDTSFECLVEATSSYAHCCCEQTAAKLLSACTMYMLAGGGGDGDDKRKKAESIIDAGIRREESMWLRGRGFKAYPEWENTPDTYVGIKASKYLWNVALLRNSGHPISKSLNDNIDKALEMARDTAKAYKYSWPPKTLSSCEDAYASLRFNSDDATLGEAHDPKDARAAQEAAIEFVRAKVAAKGVKHFLGSQPADPIFGQQVFARIEAAYAAACLFRSTSSKDKSLAIELCNAVVGAFNEQKMLYSTADSVAAIALMSELENAKITGGGIVELDGKKMSVKEALEQKLSFKTLKVIEGVASVQVAKEIIEDWSKFSAGVPMRLSLEKNGQPTRSLSSGDSVELRVVLEEGYKDGDLLWVCLPDALSRVIGGGQVKLFSVDFKGKSEVKINLAATGITVGAEDSGSQKYAVCVRNMFNEERAGSPGLQEVTVRR